MNISQRQLNLFVTTAAFGNISRASESLHLSQPALTRALQEFERQLDVALFLRTTRSLQLTQKGSEFLPVARKLLADLEDAARGIQAASAGLGGTVVLSTGTAFGASVLPAVLHAFVRSHPAVKVRVLDDNSERITQRLIQREADLGIGTPIGATRELNCHHLLSAALGILSNPTFHRIKRGVGVQDLEQLPLLQESADTSIVQALSMRRSDILTRMERGVEVSSLSLQLGMVRAGVGVAVMSALGASHRDASDLKFSLLEPLVQRDLFIMQRRDRATSPAASALMAAIVAGTRQARLHRAVTMAKQISTKDQLV